VTGVRQFRGVRTIVQHAVLYDQQIINQCAVLDQIIVHIKDADGYSKGIQFRLNTVSQRQDVRHGRCAKVGIIQLKVQLIPVLAAGNHRIVCASIP